MQRGQRFRYTSVMLSSLPIDRKAALIASGIIAAGQHLIFPYSDVSTYHLRGRLNTPMHKQNFSDIARRARVTLR